jgi:hypothetical protein
MTYSWQVKDAELRLRHKLFPPNAWMKLTDFNVLTSCPKDELHQWFLGLYGEHIIPAIIHRYTQVLQRPDLISGRGPPRTCSTYSMLSGRKCNLNYSA